MSAYATINKYRKRLSYSNCPIMRGHPVERPLMCLLYLIQCLTDVGQDVAAILDAHRQADQVGGDARLA